jgi:hypothetical protein
MPISRKTLQTVGFLDLAFRAPGWGSGVDYCHRAPEVGLGIYVSHRAMLWHHGDIGGLSTTEVYGDRSKWVAKGLQQATEDLRPSTVRTGVTCCLWRQRPPRVPTQQELDTPVGGLYGGRTYGEWAGITGPGKQLREMLKTDKS